MMALDTLLNPIRINAPSGDSLRYDPVYDQIAEARAEDDATLPTGLWAHPPKRADLALVISLAQDALARRSKDLWLAVWLGHAETKSKGIEAMPVALQLLQELQVRFWDTLHPEREDADYEARSAPLQWGLDQFATLLLELPTIAPGISLLAYKAARLDLETKAAEDLDATLAATSAHFFAERVKLFELIEQRLGELFLNCEAQYGVDGPSFSKVRRAVEEVRNTVSTLLRVRRELEPEAEAERVDAASPEPDAEPATVTIEEEEAQEPVEDPAEEEDDTASGTEEREATKGDEFNTATVAGRRDSPVAVASAVAEVERRFASREEAIAEIEAAARYLAQLEPTNPLGYAVLGARQWARVWRADAEDSAAPSSELRTKLRLLRREERWEELLYAAANGMVGERGALCPDLHHEVSIAAAHLGAHSHAASAVGVTRLLVMAGAAPTNRFEDDTPIASKQTQQWIVEEVLGAEREDGEGRLATAPELRASQEERVEASDATAAAGGSGDLFTEAEALARDGDLPGAIGLLMEDAQRSAARRKSFFRRLEVAQLCVQATQYSVGQPLLEQLLAEVTEFGLERWEGAQVPAKILFLLLQCTGVDSDEDGEQARRMAQLCTVDPVRAMQLQAEG